MAGSRSSEEAALLARAGAGEAEAFRILVDRHLSGVYRIARRVLADDMEAEDVAQETMLQLWRMARELDADEHGIGPWLRRVAANRAINRLRSKRRFDVTDEPPEQEVAPVQLRGIAENDTAQRVRTALDALPDRQRAALVLFHFEGLGQRAVAAALEVSEEAVESLLARARRKLKDMLKDEWRELLSLTEQD